MANSDDDVPDGPDVNIEDESTHRGMKVKKYEDAADQHHEGLSHDEVLSTGWINTDTIDSRGLPQTFSTKHVPSQHLGKQYRLNIYSNDGTTRTEYIRAAMENNFAHGEIADVRSYESNKPGNSTVTHAVTINTTTVSLRKTRRLDSKIEIAGKMFRTSRFDGLPHCFPTTFVARVGDQGISLSHLVDYVTRFFAGLIDDTDAEQEADKAQGLAAFDEFQTTDIDLTFGTRS
jgi:hypothetical protein